MLPPAGSIFWDVSATLLFDDCFRDCTTHSIYFPHAHLHIPILHQGPSYMCTYMCIYICNTYYIHIHICMPYAHWDCQSMIAAIRPVSSLFGSVDNQTAGCAGIQCGRKSPIPSIRCHVFIIMSLQNKWSLGYVCQFLVSSSLRFDDSAERLLMIDRIKHPENMGATWFWTFCYLFV